VSDYRALFAASPEPQLLVEGDAPVFTIIDATPAFWAQVDATPDMIGNGVLAALPERIELHASLVRAHARGAIDVMNLEAGATVRGRSVPILADGTVRWLVHRIEDVTDVVRANQGVAVELEAFRYSVSHDLRFPLRVVDGYARALDEDCGPQVDAQGRTYLAAIQKGVAKMDHMIRRLSELLELSRAPYVETTIDLSALARDIAGKHGVAIEIAGGLVAHGDRKLVEIILDALIGNAVKFTSKTEPRSIAIGAADGAFFVRDNGVGFDAKAERLFAPFRRLHRVEDYPGDGIGLATVYRAVTRHGGRVWAESAPGQGATVYFTLR
jgi:signal transduction histidine kinase